MKRGLEILRAGQQSARSLAAWSAASLDRPLARDAELTVGVTTDAAQVLGAFQRTSEVAGDAPNVRRVSGGAACETAPGTVWLVLALREPSSIVACDAPRLVNRYVRPLLRALTRVGALAHHFGRDWISSAKSPVALVSFAHDAGTGRAVFEAVVGVTQPFTRTARTSFEGRAPRAVAELAPAVTSEGLVDAAVAAYEGQATGEGLEVTRAGASLPPDAPLVASSSWDVVRDEALGRLGAARDGGCLRVGGALMVARDALGAFEDALAALGEGARDPVASAAAVDAHLGDPAAALFGVRDLASIRDLVVEAALRTPLGAPTRG